LESLQTYIDSDNFSLGDASVATKLLELQTEMALLYSAVSSRGWSPISYDSSQVVDNVAGINPISDMQDSAEGFTSLKPAIEAALSELSKFTNALRGQPVGTTYSYADEGGGPDYFTDTAQNTRFAISNDNINELNINALLGVSNFIQNIGDLGADYDFYLPSSITDLFGNGGGGNGTGPNTLIEYATQNGISPNELTALKQALLIAENAENSPWSGDGGGWKGFFFDDNNDGTVATADLIQFLIVYGQDNFVAGSISSEQQNPLDTKFFIEP
jgi:hypothetical protein